MGSADAFGQPDHRTLRGWVLATLTDRIVAGTLRPGQRLVEAELAQQMRVSRSPIREAIRQLEQEGLVVTLPNTSTVVSDVSVAELEEVYQIRDALERLAARLAAARISDQQVAALRAALERIAAVLATDDRQALVDADLGLHLLLWEAAGSARLRHLLGQLARQTRRYMHLTMYPASAVETEAALAEHRAIVDAVAARDPAAAEAAVARHLASGSERMVRALRAYLAERRQAG